MLTSSAQHDGDGILSILLTDIVLFILMSRHPTLYRLSTLLFYLRKFMANVRHHLLLQVQGG